MRVRKVVKKYSSKSQGTFFMDRYGMPYMSYFHTISESLIRTGLWRTADTNAAAKPGRPLSQYVRATLGWIPKERKYEATSGSSKKASTVRTTPPTYGFRPIAGGAFNLNPVPATTTLPPMRSSARQS